MVIGAITAGLLAASALCACGGDRSASTTSEAGPLVISGGGIAQYRAPGKDNSIEEYGHEASRAELRQAAENVHDFLVARVVDKWAKACTYLDRKFELRLTEESPISKGSVAKRCGGSVDVYLSTLRPRDRYDMSEVKAGSLRVEGDTGFLFFKSGKEEGHKLLMTREEGDWRIAANLEPTSLH